MKQRSNLCEAIVQDIKNDIINGNFKPGEKIPGEYDLGDKYSVSRYSVREAMKKLESMGLITIKHGIGSFVNQIAPESFMRPLLPVLMLSDFDMERICEARLPLEVQAISLSVERATEADLSEMKELLVQMNMALEEEENDLYNDLDLQLHLLIAESSGNQIIYEMLSTIQDILREQMKRVFVAPNSKERSIKRHEQMVEAISNKEKELARQLMTLHINDSIDYLNTEMSAK